MCERSYKIIKGAGKLYPCIFSTLFLFKDRTTFSHIECANKCKHIHDKRVTATRQIQLCIRHQS